MEKELVLFNLDPSDSLDNRLSTQFATQNVRITTAWTASRRPTDIAVISNDNEVLEVIDIQTLRDFVDHQMSQPGTVGISDTDYEGVLSHLKETTFSSRDRTENHSQTSLLRKE